MLDAGPDEGDSHVSDDARKVLVLGSYAPSLINFRGPLIAELVERGHRVLAAAPELDGATRSALHDLGAHALDVPMQRTGMNPLSDLALLFRLTGLFRKHRPDTVIAYTMKPVIWGGIAVRLARVPSFAPIFTGLGYGLTGEPSAKQKLLRRVLVRLLRLAIAQAEAVFCQNPDDRGELERLGVLKPGDPVTMIAGSGIDLRRFRANPPPEKLSFLMIARLLQAKGVREYAQAAAELHRTHPDVPCRLIGWTETSADAIDPQELKAWKREGLDYLGFREDVRPDLKACAVYVLPSWREGTPRSVLEAMATGRAIVTTDAPGCRETVTDGENGFLVPVRDPAALTAAMQRYIDDPALAARHGAASRRMAEAVFDVRRVNAAILEALTL